MSDNATVTEGSQQTGEGQVTQTTTTTVEDRLAQLEKTNARLLNESKDYKSKYQTLKEENDKKEKALLEQKESWKELLEKERNEFANERAQFQAFKKHNLSKLLEAEIVKYAPDAQDVNLVKQALPVDMINAFEEDFEIKFSGIKEGIDKIKKEKSFLFKPQTIPQMVSGKPSNPSTQSLANGATKAPQQMTRDELLAFWKANPNIK